ncbi:hypothetical protein [Streptomyces sp. NPDC026673]|uniref:hypothetical protein n=1 Tax=Streptomyces sp. NPDC026673 TaxID=3155724 RepID=UPI0033FFEF24
MGDHFQTIVDLDATPTEASTLAGHGLDWLVREGFVRADRTDCVLGARSGNPPGGHWAKAVTHPDWEPTDGLKIVTGRTVFHGGQGEVRYATCPHCACRVDFLTEDWDPIEGADEPFYAAFTTWRTTGQATVACPHCGTAPDLRAWTWDDDYFAFGCLGFEFWNWPEFDPRFLTDLARVLDGHRLVRVWGKF